MPPLCLAAIEAGQQIGLQYREDVNDLPTGAGDGIGWVQQTRGGRRRASAARSYLRPAMRRPNLQVVTNAVGPPHPVQWHTCNRRRNSSRVAAGPERADAGKEVILSAAGAIGFSSHILQLSGRR